MRHLQLVLTGALVTGFLQGCATPQATSAGSEGMELKREESSIPFFNSQRAAVTGWQADGLEGLWIEGSGREWYYAKLNSPCHGLDHAIRLGFDTGPSDRLDRFSQIIVPGQSAHCSVTSFVKSDPPPEGRRRTLDGAETK